MSFFRNLLRFFKIINRKISIRTKASSPSAPLFAIVACLTIVRHSPLFTEPTTRFITHWVRSSPAPLFAIVACLTIVRHSPLFTEPTTRFITRWVRSSPAPLFAIVACLHYRSAFSFIHRAYDSLHHPLGALVFGSSVRNSRLPSLPFGILLYSQSL